MTIAQDSLIVGEYSGGEGWVRVTDGALYSRMDLFVGGASASARP